MSETDNNGPQAWVPIVNGRPQWHSLQVTRSEADRYKESIGDSAECRIAEVHLHPAPEEVQRLRPDAARFEWLANHGGCPFAETDPVWDDPAEFRRQVDERIERDREQAKTPRT